MKPKTKNLTRLIPDLLTASALLRFAATPAVAGLGTNEPVTLCWEYPAAEQTPDLHFRVYHSTNPDLPLYKWTPLTNTAGTNCSITVPVERGRHFFYITASNWWGESDPSNIASTPAPPRSVFVSIRAHKIMPI